MSQSSLGQSPMGESRDARSPWPVVAMIAGGLLLARLAYLAWLCPYTLAEDEAHYWDWSRNLDWSYYSKGPGVAWLIALMTSVLGESEFGVRAGAALFGSIATVGVAGIAHAAFGSRRAAIASAVLFNLIPFYQVSSLLMTIDMPYVACWSLASWAAVRAIHGRSGPAWVALGASVAVGFLFKYTMVMIVPGVVVAAVMEKRGRGHEEERQEVTKSRSHGVKKNAGAWIVMGVLIAIAGLVPVAMWNAERDWPTVRHLMGHLGVKGGDVPTARQPWTIVWFLEFVGMQAGLVGPALLLMARGLLRARRDGDGPSRTLAWIGLPLIVFYVLVSLVNDAEGNWAIAGYVTLVALAGHAVTGGVPGPYPAWRWSWMFGLVVAVCFARLDVVAKLPRLGRFVPVGRLTGADVRAEAVVREMGRLEEETGLEPFVIAQHYGRASQLAFYLPRRPVVYCSSSLMNGRRTQFDVWGRTDLRLREVSLELTGRPAVLVGGVPGQWDVAFERVEPLGALAGEVKKDRVSFVGFGYRGFTGPKGR